MSMIKMDQWPTEMLYLQKNWQKNMLIEKLFMMLGVAENGKPLWKHLMLNRQRLLNDVKSQILESQSMINNVFAAHLTTPNNKLSLAASTWE